MSPVQEERSEMQGDGMIRRKFIQMVAATGAGAFSSLAALSAESSSTVTWFVQGFTCITCATGLDTLLSRQKGVISSASTYPEGKVVVRFHPSQINEHAIAGFIGELGFTVKNHA
jgi:copper chaperone CopZ